MKKWIYLQIVFLVIALIGFIAYLVTQKPGFMLMGGCGLLANSIISIIAQSKKKWYNITIKSCLFCLITLNNISVIPRCGGELL